MHQQRDKNIGYSVIRLFGCQFEAGARYTKMPACGQARPASRIISDWLYRDEFRPMFNLPGQ
jgi:hypothetical protein